MELKVLSTRENQVMSVLWNAHHSMSAHQISEECKDMSVYSVQQVLQRLLKLELIKVADIGYSNTVLTRLYIPALSQPEYIQFLLGGNKQGLYQIASFLISNNTDKKVLQDLKEQIIKKEKELGE